MKNGYIVENDETHSGIIDLIKQTEWEDYIMNAKSNYDR